MATKKMTATERRQYEELEESERIAARSLACVQLARGKRAATKTTTAKKKRPTRQEIEERKWGPSGRAHCSAFFVQNIERERDETLTALKGAQTRLSEMAGSVNAIAELLFVMKAEKVPTCRVIHAVLNGQRILDAFNK